MLKTEKGAENSINNQVSRLKEKQVFKATAQNVCKDDLINMSKNDQAYDLSKMALPEKRQLLNAIQKLDKGEIEKAYILNLLKDFYDNEFPNAEYGMQSLIRGAISYVDKTLFE